jgi:hypothetical protein
LQQRCAPFRINPESRIEQEVYVTQADRP